MKRMHVHVAVEDITAAARFYSALFAAEPSVLKPDYAKWMLEDPCVNFAISMRGQAAGLDHLGIQVEDAAELREVYDRLKAAERPVLEQGVTTCCYAKSEKSWIADPAGIAWEAFLTSGEVTVYGTGADLAPVKAARSACGAPTAAAIGAAEPMAASAQTACCG
jgi:catechol 2,3-dioxygenase-like lactoylglutathione lyase family enzyme